ncbi:hypothetical protein [Reichenbachiella sp. MALMAid0571]
MGKDRLQNNCLDSRSLRRKDETGIGRKNRTALGRKKSRINPGRE